MISRNEIVCSRNARQKAEGIFQTELKKAKTKERKNRKRKAREPMQVVSNASSRKKTEKIQRGGRIIKNKVPRKKDN